MELIKLAFANLLRNKVRASLTIIGVVIGIAALFSMVSFGTGLEKNILKTFYDNDLFTTLTITSQKIDLKKPRKSLKKVSKDTLAPPLNDSLINELSKLKEIELIYPQVNRQVKAEFDGSSQITTITGLPLELKKFKPYSELEAGTFFTNDSTNDLIISSSFLYDLVTEADSTLINKKINAKDYIGKSIELTTATLGGFNPMMAMPMFAMGGMMGAQQGVTQKKMTYKIIGVLKTNGMEMNKLSSAEIYAPINNVKKIPSLGFNSIEDVLKLNNENKNVYSTISVRAKGVGELDSLVVILKAQKINYISISEQLGEIKKGFTIVQSILGIIGFISLMVAGLGIVNTMLMSVLERTKEIGIMKSIGAEEKQIRTLFFYEAGFIGACGAIGGMLLGWGATIIANAFVNNSIVSKGGDPVVLFDFPIWLIAGAFLFGLCMALIAGVYPAIRASRVDPVEALRQN